MRKALLWGLAALGSATHAQAADLTEESYLAVLDENEDHGAARALGENLARAEAARQRAGTLANPRVEVWHEQSGDSPGLTNWTAAWTPPLDGRYGLGKRAAQAGLAAAREELVADRAALRREVRGAFAAWSIAQGRCTLLSRQLEGMTRLAEQERQRAQVGSESWLAARRLTLAEARVRAALRAAEAVRGRAEAAARGWQPELPADVSPVVPRLPHPPEDVNPAAAPQVRFAERRREQARLEQRLAGRFWGFPTLQAGVQRLDDGGLSKSGPILAASWSLPLFDRNQAGRAEARARAQIATARLELVRAQSRAEIRGALEAYRTLFTAAREARDASATSERVIKAAAAAYRAGESSLTDLLAALGSAFDIRLTELELLDAALAVHRDLEVAVGQPLTKGGAR